MPSRGGIPPLLQKGYPMKLADMKMSKKQAKESNMPAMTSSGKMDEYPWGLKISLDNDALKKLEHVTGYNVGDEVQIMAVGSIVDKSARETQDGKEDRSISIQIKKLACELEDESKMSDEDWARRKRRNRG